jgi:tripartite-type tricarboxylate transporter receptor subunit TctC
MGIVAPPGTPAAVTAKLSAAIARAVDEPEFKRRLTELQAEPVGNTPAEMAEVIRQDTERWAEVIRTARITVE